MIHQIIKNDLDEARQVLNTFIENEDNLRAIENAITIMAESLKNGGKVLSCGNGGSLCDSMHFAEELTGRYRKNRKSLPAIALSDPSHISCVANDFGYEYIFSRWVDSLGNSGDVLLAFSTSGNSANVIEAVRVAAEKGMKVIGMTGKSGGKLAELCDVEIRAPKSEYADRVQEIHIKVVHIMIRGIEQSMGFE